MDLIYRLDINPWNLSDKSEIFRYERINQILLKNNNNLKYDNVLEIGGGIGDHSEFIKKISNNLTSIEPSKTACIKYRERFGNEIKLINSSFEDFNFDNKFDLIIASEVLIFTKNITEQLNKINNNSNKFIITNYYKDHQKLQKYFDNKKYNQTHIDHNKKKWIIIYN